MNEDQWKENDINYLRCTNCLKFCHIFHEAGHLFFCNCLDEQRKMNLGQDETKR